APAVGGLVLGVGEVTPAKLATAYAAFANGGIKRGYYDIDRSETYDGAVVFDSQPRFAGRACDTPQQRAAAPRTGALRSLHRPLAGGTSSPPQDPAASRAIVWPEVPPEMAPPLGPLVPAERAISAQNAYLMTDMMRDVIRRGSGAAAGRELRRRDIAGKTGMTNDGKDTWFVGFTDELVGAA